MTLSSTRLSEVPDQKREPQKTGGGFQRNKGRIANVAFAASGLLGLAGCNPISSQDIAQNWKSLGYAQMCDNIFTKQLPNGTFKVVAEKDGRYTIYNQITNTSIMEDGDGKVREVVFLNKTEVKIASCKLGDATKTKDHLAQIMEILN